MAVAGPGPARAPRLRAAGRGKIGSAPSLARANLLPPRGPRNAIRRLPMRGHDADGRPGAADADAEAASAGGGPGRCAQPRASATRTAARLSSTYARTIDSKSASAVKPIARARLVSKRPAQVLTSAITRGSGAW